MHVVLLYFELKYNMKITSLLSYFVYHQYYELFDMISNTMTFYAPYVMLTPLKIVYVFEIQFKRLK